MAELKRIAPTLFSFYGIDTIDGQTQVLEACKLKPVASTYPVAFELPFRCCFEDQPVPEEAMTCSRKKHKKTAISLSVARASSDPRREVKAAAASQPDSETVCAPKESILFVPPETSCEDVNESQNPYPQEVPVLQEPQSPESTAGALVPPPLLQEETVHA